MRARAKSQVSWTLAASSRCCLRGALAAGAALPGAEPGWGCRSAQQRQALRAPRTPAAAELWFPGRGRRSAQQRQALRAPSTPAAAELWFPFRHGYDRAYLPVVRTPV